MKCYVCDQELTSSNETDEHIIINAAGGRLKSRKLICRDCNSKFGQVIDAALAEQVNDIASLLMIDRQRGKPKPPKGLRESTGESYTIERGGKPKLAAPKFSKTKDGERTSFSITARTETELRSMLTGIAKKYPRFDIETAMKSATWRKEKINDPLRINATIGGSTVFRAVCKCAINYFIYCRGEVSQIKHLIPYILGNAEMDVVWMHYQEGLYPLNADESFHILHLVGDSSQAALYCYVDYFNTYKYIVLLNENYTGPDLQETYCYDVIKEEEVEREVSMRYDRESLIRLFTNKDAKPFDGAQKSFNHSLTLAVKRQNALRINELLERAMQNALTKYPEGALLTEEMINEAIEEIMNAVAPYIVGNTN